MLDQCAILRDVTWRDPACHVTFPAQRIGLKCSIFCNRRALLWIGVWLREACALGMGTQITNCLETLMFYRPIFLTLSCSQVPCWLWCCIMVTFDLGYAITSYWHYREATSYRQLLINRRHLTDKRIRFSLYRINKCEMWSRVGKMSRKPTYWPTGDMLPTPIGVVGKMSLVGKMSAQLVTFEFDLSCNL